MPVSVVPPYLTNKVMPPVVASPGHYHTEDDDDEEREPIRFRPGCRGNNMSESGDTEWNVFLDVYAWHIVSRIVAEASSVSSRRRPIPKLYVLSSGATEDMPITMQDFSNGFVEHKQQHHSHTNDMNNNNNHNNHNHRNLDTDKVTFMTNLAKNFLAAGEAKWWDAQLVVAMADIITGVAHKDSVCSVWKETTGFDINLEWNHVTKEEGRKGIKNPYGSITDSRNDDDDDDDDPRIRTPTTTTTEGPHASFCVHGNVAAMQHTYWSALNGDVDEVGSKVIDPDTYLRSLVDYDENTI